MFNALRGAVTIMFEDGASPSGLDFSGLLAALTGAVTAQQILTYMAAIVGAGIGIYVAYVFGRKGVSAFLRAIKGKKPTI